MHLSAYPFMYLLGRRNLLNPLYIYQEYSSRFLLACETYRHRDDGGCLLLVLL